MTLDPDTCYRALLARDERFDGRFFVAVTTTGVYCRPVCRARTPRQDRCVFYRAAAEADRNGYRACLRCRPELAPGNAPIDAIPGLVTIAVAQIQSGALNQGSLEDLAHSLGVTPRHLRRAMQAQLGVAPVELAQSCRVALAKQLLQDSSLSITDVAFASGFQSIRRFNALIQAKFGRAPTALRKTKRQQLTPDDRFSIFLEYRTPYNYDSILEFLRARFTHTVEYVTESSYARTISIGQHSGWFVVSKALDRAALKVEISLSLAPVLMPLVAKVKRLFDLDAHPHTIDQHLLKDRQLAKLVKNRLGLRIPGTVDGFELAVHTILGQQISVAAARTLHSRLAQSIGQRIETPFPTLSRLTPTAQQLAQISEQKLIDLGILSTRAHTIHTLAQAVSTHALTLDSPVTNIEQTLQSLKDIPGIGDWTAQYIAMRNLGWPDAFPESDLGIRKALGNVTARQARDIAESWRPWRGYAVMHLWSNL